jgi:hypothetical protein
MLIAFNLKEASAAGVFPAKMFRLASAKQTTTFGKLYNSPTILQPA